MQIPDIPVAFGLTISPFGLLVAIGVLFGYRFAHWQARRLRLDAREIDRLCLAVVVTGFIGSHWVEAVFYQWDRLLAEGPLFLLRIWDGMSSFGGMFGAIAGYSWFARRVKGSPLPYMDLAVNGFALGWVFGRLGCTLAFDHPGGKSDFPLAFQFPGGPRHNLGFYEFLFTVLIVLPTLLGLLYRGPGKLGPRPGMSTAILIFEYVPVRFLLDFLRAQDVRGADARFLGLTPGHYSAILLAALGCWVYRASRKLPASYLEQLRDRRAWGSAHPGT